MTSEEQYMIRCLELASNGLGNVAPNPMVGCVIVYDGKIIGEGFHRKFGEAHAEVNAIHHVIEKRGEKILRSSELYVSLEPCSHFGKTPPCVDLILEKKIPKVFIGCTDTSSNVNGEGIKKLEAAGTEVQSGIFESHCREINKRFFIFNEKKRPFIILKWAQSMDKFLAPKKQTEENRWISNEYSRKLSHKWRSEQRGILVGTNTVIMDNPQLNVRDWAGKNPTRILIDRSLYLSETSHVLDNSAPTLIFNETKNHKEKNTEWVATDFSKNQLMPMINELYNRNVQSVMVEGGAFTLQNFIEQNLWDEARIFISNKFLNDGVKAPQIDFRKMILEEKILDDKLFILRNN